jgi:hypothetical protein
MKKLTENDKKILDCMFDDVSNMVCIAQRYYIGRKTIAASVFIDDLEKAWPYISDTMKECIFTDVEFQLRLHPNIEFRDKWQRILNLFRNDNE